MADTPTSRIAYKVLINGTPLSNEVGVMSVSTMCYFNKIASAKLKVEDGDVAARDFLQSNSDLFKPGNELEIQLGYDDNPSTIFKGIIIRHCIKVKGGSFLEIEAKDKAVRLSQVRKSKYFIKKTDKDIIEELVGAYGLDKSVDVTEGEHTQMVQYYCSDWDFILMRAEANAMFVHTDNGEILVKKPIITPSSALTATYGDNIIEFEGEMDARRHFVKMQASAWDFDKQKTNPEATRDGVYALAESGDLAASALGEVLGQTMELKHNGRLLDKELELWANAHAMKNRLSKASGRVRILGNPSIKPGQNIRLAGVGDRFNGDVFVTGVLHQYDGEFTTDIQFGWAQDWFYKHDDIIEKPSSGLVPGVTGLQIGKVKKLTLPTDGSGRPNHIQIDLPMVSKGGDGIWARVAVPDAGQDRGFVFRPEVGDEVIVGFINDDPRDAVILGMLHSQAKLPPSTLPQNDENHKKGLVTRSGMTLIFDDENSVVTISVPAGGAEKSITIGESGAIEMKDEHQNIFKMDAAGITISTPKIIKIEGQTAVNIN
ncbi:type VI secretion system tip protein VgrG [Dyadobacter sp. LJ53]|uniref:type VI secretion system tip protein VgrG n=1 Tax=Dyadobacter chenwenxiniae TaxID=2906456 RepID=UPI001F29BD49|nr:type VI secretion system tip protein VgrG [Dyadobacter chenwenxiniae]MCF0048663.1 type VI secretion system tip protein VgrG [Dyadobacter chenwenxiniae]